MRGRRRSGGLHPARRLSRHRVPGTAADAEVFMAWQDPPAHSRSTGGVTRPLRILEVQTRHRGWELLDPQACRTPADAARTDRNRMPALTQAYVQVARNVMGASDGENPATAPFKVQAYARADSCPWPRRPRAACTLDCGSNCRCGRDFSRECGCEAAGTEAPPTRNPGHKQPPHNERLPRGGMLGCLDPVIAVAEP